MTQDISSLTSESSHLHQTYQFKIDIPKLDSLQSLIVSCFKLISDVQLPVHQPQPVPVQQQAATTSSQIVVLNKREYSTYSLKTSKWTTYKNAFAKSIEDDMSVVYAQGNVYLFGGSASPNKYYRISFLENQQAPQCYDGAFQGGGRLISSCFDGDKYIYLVGGQLGTKSLDRVARLNIVTQQFDYPARVQTGLFGTRVFFHKPSYSLIVVDAGMFFGYNIIKLNMMTDEKTTTTTAEQLVANVVESIDNLPTWQCVQQLDSNQLSTLNIHIQSYN
ncbi:hypothetical protein SAMD00019534_017350 [Acytostelium subglobosum LB1]|uniref:hypothetical protein n=1 Tax=Acytostelium subglobosum LB1 TaxID=1410327 RepID=UPI000644D59F|nr:hypothetical protein SAMD00019534_017350 [Acytostelium subglobosum LB1]GAM18560.1 hypothetical protein SAMD00019534_017350 [Acytostelium subglobosum LB1]|eukprot:XP_012757780.1 hypothetical protein SAMD00019534_017350 [Acytostelium subglobosum LB1]